MLVLARKEADRLRHNSVCTEHVLLGLIKLGQGVAVDVLRKMGLDLEAMRTELEEEITGGPNRGRVGYIPLTQPVKKVLALANMEAKSLNHPSIDTEHLLLGLLREG